MTITSLPTFRASDAVLRVEQSSRRVQQPQSSGQLVSLAMGEPNFDTPQVIREAAERALANGRTHYSPLAGEASLRGALADRIGELTGGPVDAGDVLVTHGGTGGLAATILGLVSPGDRVVIPDPTYSLYGDLVSMAGGVAVHVPLGPDLHWDLDRLRDALAGARLFVFCNPGNPTGIVHTREELHALAGFLEGSDTIVLSDEAYFALDFTGRPFTSALQVDGLRDRTVYCQTFSKSYAMTGWRVGYLWGPTEMIRAAARVHNTFNGSVNTAVQDAAQAALEHAGPDVERMRSAYAVRREIMRKGLQGVQGLTLSEPEGAFYFFPRYDLPIPSVDMVARLREAGIAVRPGFEFGAGGEHHLRLSYAASEDAIRTGTARLAAAFESLRSSVGVS
jgi:aspartate aminotransferase